MLVEVLCVKVTTLIGSLYLCFEVRIGFLKNSDVMKWRISVKSSIEDIVRS